MDNGSPSEPGLTSYPCPIPIPQLERKSVSEWPGSSPPGDRSQSLHRSQSSSSLEALASSYTSTSPGHHETEMRFEPPAPGQLLRTTSLPGDDRHGSFAPVPASPPSSPPVVITAHTIITGLLKSFCSMHHKNTHDQEILFRAAYQRLQSLNILPLESSWSAAANFVALSGHNFLYDLFISSSTFQLPPAPLTRAGGEDLKMSPMVWSIPRALPSTGSEYVGVSKGRFKTEFMLVAAIGHGAFGVVYRATNVVDNRAYAVKCIRLEHITMQGCLMATREVYAISQFDHPNIVRYYSSWLELEPRRTKTPSSASNQQSGQPTMPSGDGWYTDGPQFYSSESALLGSMESCTVPASDSPSEPSGVLFCESSFASDSFSSTSADSCADEFQFSISDGEEDDLEILFADVQSDVCSDSSSVRTEVTARVPVHECSEKHHISSMPSPGSSDFGMTSWCSDGDNEIDEDSKPGVGCSCGTDRYDVCKPNICNGYQSDDEGDIADVLENSATLHATQPHSRWKKHSVDPAIEDALTLRTLSHPPRRKSHGNDDVIASATTPTRPLSHRENGELVLDTGQMNRNQVFTHSPTTTAFHHRRKLAMVTPGCMASNSSSGVGHATVAGNTSDRNGGKRTELMERGDPELSQASESDYQLESDGPGVHVLYIQMQLCDDTLLQYLSRRNLRSEAVNEPECWRIFMEILNGVEHVHSHGLMHRDLKPANIFLFGSERRVKIGDFGLARAYMSLPNGKAGARDAMTSRELIVSSSTAALALSSDVGTASYTSPEQLQNKPYDAKSDMYSLGIILLELFAPFSTVTERCISVSAARKGTLPPDVVTKHPKKANLIHQLMHKNPSLRPCSTSLVRQLVREKMDNESVRTISEREENETATEITNLVKEVEQLKVLLKEKEARIALLLSTGNEDAIVQ